MEIFDSDFDSTCLDDVVENEQVIEKEFEERLQKYLQNRKHFLEEFITSYSEIITWEELVTFVRNLINSYPNISGPFISLQKIVYKSNYNFKEMGFSNKPCLTYCFTDYEDMYIFNRIIVNKVIQFINNEYFETG